ncbi:MAG TPA: cardiolipin synthase [Thermoanaerobaculia bacterium]
MKRTEQESRFGIWTSRGTTYVRMPMIVFIGALLTIITLTILFWSVKRKTTLELRVEDPGELSALMPSLVGLTQSSLDQGNKVEVLQNGSDFFPLLFRDLTAAKESIHFETYIWYDGEVSRQLATLLARKAREGVVVRIMVDAAGGRQLKGEVRDLLEGAGAHVTHFNPFRLRNLGRMNNRDHRKLAVIDGRIGFIGGHGIADEWMGDGQNREYYRDTALRVTGPVVNRMQAAFSENWIKETGEILAADRYFPRLTPTGTSAAHLAYTSPTGSVSSVQILYYLAIKAARREIIIQNPYLLPDGEAIEALAGAVARGVEVKIMVPSDEATDMPIVQHASHRNFGTLLRRGVRIWEYRKTLLHQKVMIVDGVWSAVGSTNFDDRSFRLNHEASIGVLDPAVAAELRAAFEEDLKHATELNFEQWKGRSFWHKTIDGVAYLGRSQM